MDQCAAREVVEETGLDLPMRRADVPSPDWFVYLAEAPEGAEVRLSHDHDRYVWLPLDRAAARVLPARVRTCVIRVAHALSTPD